MGKSKNKDYYEVLGVPPRSHVRVIEETYWERAHHLSRIPTRKAAQRLGALNEAYETLGSPHRRAAYDARRGSRQSDENGHGSSSANLVRSLLNILSKPFRPD